MLMSFFCTKHRHLSPFVILNFDTCALLKYQTLLIMLFWNIKLYPLCPFEIPNFVTFALLKYYINLGGTYSVLKYQTLPLMSVWNTKLYHLCPFEILNFKTYSVLKYQTLLLKPFGNTYQTSLCIMTNRYDHELTKNKTRQIQNTFIYCGIK